MDWLNVVPIAAIVSAFVTLTIRFFDKPRPSLSVEAQLTRSNDELRRWEDQHGEFLGVVVLTNSGDGAAYELEVHGDGCVAAFSMPPIVTNTSDRWVWKIPVLESGAQVAVHTKVPSIGADDARLVIRWTRSPGLGRLKRLYPGMLEISIREIESACLFPVAVHESAHLPQGLRRWRRLEQYTEIGRIRSQAPDSDLPSK